MASFLDYLFPGQQGAGGDQQSFLQNLFGSLGGPQVFRQGDYNPLDAQLVAREGPAQPPAAAQSPGLASALGGLSRSISGSLEDPLMLMALGLIGGATPQQGIQSGLAGYMAGQKRQDERAAQKLFTDFLAKEAGISPGIGTGTGTPSTAAPTSLSPSFTPPPPPPATASLSLARPSPAPPEPTGPTLPATPSVTTRGPFAPDERLLSYQVLTPGGQVTAAGTFDQSTPGAPASAPPPPSPQEPPADFSNRFGGAFPGGVPSVAAPSMPALPPSVAQPPAPAPAASEIPPAAKLTVGPGPGQLASPVISSSPQPPAPPPLANGAATPAATAGVPAANAGKINTLLALIAHPGATEGMRAAATLMLKPLMPEDNKIMQLPDGTIVGVNARTGAATKLFEFNKPEWKVLYKDPNTGVEQYGWVNPAQAPKEGAVSPYTPPGTTQTSPDITGDEFLKTLDPGRANQIKAIAEGRIAPPSGFALRSPQIQALVRDVAQYEPGFDLTSWTARNKTRADFASGKMGQNISSFNTAISHLDTLSKAADALGNKPFQVWNTVGNAINKATGDPTITNFETARTAVTDELTRAFRGTGGNVHDIVQWEQNLSSSNSPEQLKAAIKQAVELLRGRIEAVGDQYSRGMGKTTDAISLLSPKAQAGIARLTGETPPGGAGAAAAPPAAPAAGQVPFAINPKTGQRIEVRDGQWKEFRNGQWVPVQ